MLYAYALYCLLLLLGHEFTTIIFLAMLKSNPSWCDVNAWLHFNMADLVKCPLITWWP